MCDQDDAYSQDSLSHASGAFYNGVGCGRAYLLSSQEGCPVSHGQDGLFFNVNSGISSLYN